MKKLIIVLFFSALFGALMVLDTMRTLYIDYTGMELAYIAIILGYAGVSQWTAYLRSGELPQGQVYNGNVMRLYIVMIISFIIAALSLVLSMGNPEVMLPVGSCFTAFGTASAAYVVGQSAKIKKENEGGRPHLSDL